MVAETEVVRSKEVNVHVSRTTVSFKFEMMMLNVAQPMAHFGFAATERLGPLNTPVPLDRRGYGDGVKFRINHQFWSERTGAELGARQVEVVLFFDLMIREFISGRHAHAIRAAIRATT